MYISAAWFRNSDKRVEKEVTMRLLLVLVLFYSTVSECSASPTNVMTPGKKGPQVVTEEVKRVEKVLGSTKMLVERTALVESDLGRQPKTYRPGYHGGIWQVDEACFQDRQDTKNHPKLRDAFPLIKKEWGVDWSKVRHRDLRKPLYSGVAARLKYWNISYPIPTPRIKTGNVLERSLQLNTG